MKRMKNRLGVLLVFVVAFIGIGTISGCDVDGPDNCNQQLPVSSETIMMGDSVIAMSRPECENITTELGLLTGEKYPDYAMSGAKMVGSNYYGYIPSIPSQWNDASSEMPGIENVIMDGGGNDILADCSSWELPLCESVIEAAMDEFIDLESRMRTDGVATITYLGLYETPEGGSKAMYNESINFGMDLMADLCPQLGVFWVDPREAFSGHPEYFKEDDTHPTHEGSIVLAGLIYDSVLANGIVQ